MMKGENLHVNTEIEEKNAPGSLEDFHKKCIAEKQNWGVHIVNVLFWELGHGKNVCWEALNLSLTNRLMKNDGVLKARLFLKDM